MSIARFILALLCSAALVSCEAASEPQSSVADPNAIDLQAGADHGRGLVGSWKALSVLSGEDEILRGTDFSLRVTFESDDSYLVEVSGDEGNVICAGTSSCTISGTYEHTSYMLTFIDDDGPDTGYYAFCG
ncbi:MAG TPA: hypothetical protein VLC48_07230, partial [Gemmatimonadota bacterium]|nr:hypothetical protein [Gemmatimonadota bacterium]